MLDIVDNVEKTVQINRNYLLILYDMTEIVISTELISYIYKRAGQYKDKVARRALIGVNKERKLLVFTKLIEILGFGINTKIFDDKNEAIQWLCEEKKLKI
jgi:hypothetical protein